MSRRMVLALALYVAFFNASAVAGALTWQILHGPSQGAFVVTAEVVVMWLPLFSIAPVLPRYRHRPHAAR